MRGGRTRSRIVRGGSWGTAAVGAAATGPAGAGGGACGDGGRAVAGLGRRIAAGLAAAGATGALTFGLASCSPAVTPDPVAVTPSTAPSTPSGGTTTEPGDATAAQAVDSDALGWLAGNQVTLTRAEYDPTAGQVTVTAVVENSAQTESFSGLYSSWVLLDTGSGAPVPATSFSSVGVPEATTEVEIVFGAPLEGVDLETASVILGPAGTKTWSLPLAAGAPGVGVAPVDVSASGTADAAGLSFTATAARLMPWTCADSDDYGPGGTGRVTYEPVADDKSGLIVWGDFVESVAHTGGNGITALTLTQPDGLTVNGIGAVWQTFARGDRVEQYGACFTVDDPAQGKYRLTVEAYRGGSGRLPITVQ